VLSAAIDRLRGSSYRLVTISELLTADAAGQSPEAELPPESTLEGRAKR